MQRYSLDISKGWPVAIPDDKGPLIFLTDSEADKASALSSSERRVKELEAALRIIADGLHDGPNSMRHVARSALGGSP